MTDARERIATEIKNLATKGWLNKREDLEFIFREIVKRAEQLEAAPAQGSVWVSVKDRLPEKRQRVLIWFRESPTEWMTRFGEITGDGHWRPEGGNGNFDDWVTHWMPLPAPPSVPQASPEPPRTFEEVDEYYKQAHRRLREDAEKFARGEVLRQISFRRDGIDILLPILETYNTEHGLYVVVGEPPSVTGQASAPEGEKR